MVVLDDSPALPAPEPILVVLKLGSLHCQSGISGEDAVRKNFLAVIPSEDGTPRKIVADGVIPSMEDFSMIVKGALGQGFDAAVDASGILVCDLPRHTQVHRKKMAAVLFDQFKFPKVLFYNRLALSALGAMRPTALVLELSDDGSYCTAVVDCVAERPVRYSPVGGRYLSQVLHDALKRYSCFDGHVQEFDMRCLKAKCNVAASSANFSESTARLAQGGTTAAGEEFQLMRKMRCTDGRMVETFHLPPAEALTAVPEPLFQPKLLPPAFPQGPSVVDLIEECLAKTAPELRATMLSNIVVAGRGTQFPGFVGRLKSELVCKYPEQEVSVIADNARSILSWMGGTILTSMRSMDDNGFIGKELWDAHGQAMLDGWSTN
jgi:hypothetical protein